MKKYLCISATHYNLLLFFLLTDFLDKTIFMVAPELIKEEDYFFAYSKNENKKIQKKENKRIFKEIQEKFLKNVEYDVYAQDHILKYYSFLEEFYLIEDGLKTYTESDKEFLNLSKKSFFTQIKRYLSGKICPHGSSKKVKKVFLRGLLPTPKCLEKKVEYIDIFELWKNKSSKEKEWINNYYNFSKQQLSKLSNKSTILFTQPLSEDDIISEERKIEIYKEILKDIDTDKLVIKSHPREITNYKEFFPNIEIINDKIPFELYLLNGFECKHAITIFSTAVYTLKNTTQVDFYGTDTYPELLEKFGSIKYERER